MTVGTTLFTNSPPNSTEMWLSVSSLKGWWSCYLSCELCTCKQFLEILGQDSRSKAWRGCGYKQKVRKYERKKKRLRNCSRLKDIKEAWPLNEMHNPPFHFGPGWEWGLEGENCHKGYDWGNWQNMNMESMFVREQCFTPKLNLHLIAILWDWIYKWIYSPYIKTELRPTTYPENNLWCATNSPGSQPAASQTCRKPVCCLNDNPGS